MKIFFKIFGLTLVLLSFAPGALAEDKTFNRPTIRFGEEESGIRLDVCLNFGKDCGQVVADMFCKRRWFYGAKAFRTESGIGRTRLITNVYDINRNIVCNGSHCTGFEYITCSKDDRPSEAFSPPVLKTLSGSYRLDYCKTWARDCGQPAADYFCKIQGFSRAHFWRKDPFVGKSQLITTALVRGKLLGKQLRKPLLCSGSGCETFQSITCS
jgi:hypothetical protein